MDLFYIDRRLAKRWPGESADGPSAAAVTAILEHRTLPDGMPVMLDAAMRPIEPLCSWFRHMAYEGLRPETMQTYAQIVRRLVEFLSRRGIDVFSATEADLVAFHSARTETQAAPIGEVTWDKDRAAIKKLYRWLKDERYVRQLPYLARSHRGPMGTAMHREPKIRHMELEQYTYFRDVGLGGLLPAGQVDPAFRGWAPHRGRAALELALMSGMRLQEWSTMLLPELGVGARRPGEGVEFTLERCAKYGLMRRVWVPSAALDAVDMFLLLERPQMVEKAQRSLKAHAPDLFMVERVDADRGRLYGIYDGRRREWQIEALTPQMRHIAVMEGEFGLEPLAVFIGHGGRMLGPSRWDGVRRAAWRRMKEHADAPGAPRLAGIAWRFHDARHTFALQLLLTLLARGERQAEATRRGVRTQISQRSATTFNAVLGVQRALGHLQISSTYHYLNYLDDPTSAIEETFRDWAMNETATYAEIGRRVLAADGLA